MPCDGRSFEVDVERTPLGGRAGPHGGTGARAIILILYPLSTHGTATGHTGRRAMAEMLT